MLRDILSMLIKIIDIKGLKENTPSFVNQFCSLMTELYKGIIGLSTKNSIFLDFTVRLYRTSRTFSFGMKPAAAAGSG